MSPLSDQHDHWMRRCLRLARLGAGSAAPNPLVGAVLVRFGEVLAEGWHKAAGGPHAEVECLRAWGDAPVPESAILYVNLEPCSHHGRTPPCADMLIQRKVRQVVIGQTDPFPQVAGRGIRKLTDAGIVVLADVLADECRWTQRRFLTSVEHGRPWIVLKWARSVDGFLDRHERSGRGVQRISSPETDVMVHRWRTEEQAILVGSRTVLNDDPALTVRHVAGRQPLRVVLDRKGITPHASKVFDRTADTLLFTEAPRPSLHVEQVLLMNEADPIDSMLAELHRRGIRSIMVEGGSELLSHFIDRGLWDEARVITGQAAFHAGTSAPVLVGTAVHSTTIGQDRVELITPQRLAGSSWDW
ncbi:MAG: bifunctional diaminohydroxyphosphoribosylaminopyrimidine deaminase/5-amino-6-(5-phosphoribosylamino)uracil reductase RibD [Flavobacteriales bacterium]|nr:bifunctional diaminohydroxyphosphoribosylaminopyrimidine deaminase/5-amino-6-(5-phosphoribosylamino)uracil reductase RibD [Flavobacteriales bacterium]